MEYQGYDIAPTQTLIPKIQRVLESFRSGGFPIYHTRQGKLAFLCVNKFLVESFTDQF